MAAAMEVDDDVASSNSDKSVGKRRFEVKKVGSVIMCVLIYRWLSIMSLKGNVQVLFYQCLVFFVKTLCKNSR